MQHFIKLGLVVLFVGNGFLSALLVTKHIGEGVFIFGFCVCILSSIAIMVLPKLKELNLRDLKLVLEQANEIKHELENIYGNIDALRSQPYVLDKVKARELGLKTGHLTTSDAVMRYPCGCIKRERERLARVFSNASDFNTVATGIADSSMDDLVFKWNGPEVLLDTPPKSAEHNEPNTTK